MSLSALTINGYQEYKPQPDLQQFVECYWLHTFETKSESESPIQKCLPFGALELILHLGDNPCHAFIGGRWQVLPQAFLVGIYRDSIEWKAIGSSRKFGVRLKPESMLQLFNISAASLFSQFTDIESIFGREINRLIDSVHRQTDIKVVISLVEQFLRSKLVDADLSKSHLLDATELIRQYKGRLSIEAVSSMLSISRRQLERIFKSGYGTSPKTFQRIIRFRNAYEAFYQISTAPDWQDISHYYGYSDQAHFIREFKEFAAEVPSSVYQYDQQYFRRHDKPVVINQS